MLTPPAYPPRTHYRYLNTSSKYPAKSKNHAIPASIAARTAASTQSQSSKVLRGPDLKSVNAFAVSQASAGGMRGRAPRMKSDRMSPEYRSAARKITLAMVSAPIAIVTSYYLAMRVWGGAERKSFDVESEEDT